MIREKKLDLAGGGGGGGGGGDYTSERAQKS
jgi:hypothetical protein